MELCANAKAHNTIFALIRTGFSTHAIDMGQHAIHLNYTYIVNDASVTYTVTPLPATKQIARLFVPGPAIFVTIGGVPSIGMLLTVGNKRGAQGPVPFTIPYGSALQALAAPVSSTKFTADLRTHNSSSSSWSITKIATIAGAGAAVVLVVVGVCFWRRTNKADTAAARHWLGSRIQACRHAGRIDPRLGQRRLRRHPARRESAYESYRMQGGGESTRPLAGSDDQPQGGSRGHGDQSSPLSCNPSPGAA
ncbi:hypothetical protein ACQY0O_004147 [Thecaphora frezii]